MLKAFLEKKFKDFDERSYVLIKLQVLIVAMLLALFLRGASFYAFIALEGILAAYYLFEIFVELRKLEKEDFGKYALFFIGLFLFIQGAWLPFVFVGGFRQVFALGISEIIGLLLFTVLFRLLLGRNYTYGKVVSSDGKIAVVETNYDLLAFTQKGRFVVDSAGKIEPGKKVKVAVKSFFLARKPYKIAE
ncbi:MAG: DUF2101 family protein [Candidatus Diapherotrites archaeon]